MPRIITDPRALHEKYVPHDLQHRSGEIDALSSALRPIVDERDPEHVCIFGPSGVGKTTLARYVVTELEHTVAGLRWGYVNCLTETGQRDVLHTLLRDLGEQTPARREGTSPATYLDRLREVQEPVVAIIDEVSVLRNALALISLYEVPDVTVVAISVDENSLLADVDTRLGSRFRSAEKIYLDPYSHAELRDIVAERAGVGLQYGAITDEALDRIATLAEGDARLGIAMLRKSAKTFTSTDTGQITVDVIDAVADEARRSVRDRDLSLLNSQQLLLFEIIDEAGEITTTELHEVYERRADEPRAKSTRRSYLDILKDYNLIDADGSGRATTYRSLVPEE